MSEAESVGSILSRGRMPRPRKGRQKLELLAANWEAIAGKRVAPHSRPTRLARGVLTVTARGPAWAAEVSMQTDRLIKRAASLLGPEAIRKVRVQSRGTIGEERGARPAPVSREDEALEASFPEGRLGEEIRALEDEEMGAALARMVRTNQARQQGSQDDA